jgi:nucleoside-diphosphate-sugar epimerase
VDAAKYAHELKLPITRVMTGFFIDTIFLPWFHIDLAHNKASIVGDGNQPVSFTHRKDVGRLLTQLILDDSKEEVIRTGTETKTLNEAFAVYEQIKKSKLQITKETVQAVQERVKQPGMGMMAMAVDCLRMAIAEGKASNKPPLYTGNLKNFITLSDYFSSLSN